MNQDVPPDSFYLRDLHVQNFRCLSSLTINFHPKINVLSAVNAGGKTAILDTIAIALRPYVDVMEGRSSSKGFGRPDIRRVPDPEGLMNIIFPVRVEALGMFFGQELRWARELASERARTITADAKTLKQAANQLIKIVQDYTKHPRKLKTTWTGIN